MSQQLFIGLMSGTSLDGIDAALVSFEDAMPNDSDSSLRLIATHTSAFDVEFQRELLALCSGCNDEINRLGSADKHLGTLYAQAVNELLAQKKLTPKDIAAIGCHGQTVRHCPQTNGKPGYTIQIGDPNTLAELVGITAVADFRRRDMAADGEGAPLASSFHQAMFSSPNKTRLIVNIGGIGNVTYLPPTGTQEAIGFDTGPGNTLLDSWIYRHKRQRYDDEGKWASTGKVDAELLNALLQHPYFALPPPKSTGREVFNLHLLDKTLAELSHAPQAHDVQATLAEFTAVTICDSLRALPRQPEEILLCGGGAYNRDLVGRLQKLCADLPVMSTKTLGIKPDWVEAVAFAWLARQRLHESYGNLPSVTGASGPRVLGAIYFGSHGGATQERKAQLT